jgi:hypothetical protein
VWRRLFTQRVAGEPFAQPEAMIDWLVAVQSQDVPGASWSVGQRVKDGTVDVVLGALNAGRILRTHVLRPTWHFVTPADIRWLLDLTAPRIKALNAYYQRQAELDDETLARSQSLLVAALQGGNHRTRPELAAMLAEVGIVADGFRLTYIMMDAELNGVVCSGVMKGKQQTYALLDERAPNTRRLQREEALAELARRFFVGHGPATLGEYVRWSGLTVADAKQGLEQVKSDLEQAEVEGHTVWFGPVPVNAPPVEPVVYLLPEYDECVLTYNDLGYPDLPGDRSPKPEIDTFYRPVIVNGHRAGSWRRQIVRREVVIEVRLFASLGPAEEHALTAATERYGAYLGLPARWVHSGDE